MTKFAFALLCVLAALPFNESRASSLSYGLVAAFGFYGAGRSSSEPSSYSCTECRVVKKGKSWSIYYKCPWSPKGTSHVKYTSRYDAIAVSKKLCGPGPVGKTVEEPSRHSGSSGERSWSERAFSSQ